MRLTELFEAKSKAKIELQNAYLRLAEVREKLQENPTLTYQMALRNAQKNLTHINLLVSGLDITINQAMHDQAEKNPWLQDMLGELPPARPVDSSWIDKFAKTIGECGRKRKLRWEKMVITKVNQKK